MPTTVRLGDDGKTLHVRYALSNGSAVERTYTYPDAATAKEYAAHFVADLTEPDIVGAAARLRHARQLNRDLIGLTDLPWSTPAADLSGISELEGEAEAAAANAYAAAALGEALARLAPAKPAGPPRLHERLVSWLLGPDV